MSQGRDQSEARLERARVEIGGGATVSAEIAGAGDAAIVLAHGAGNDMCNPLLSAVHLGLAGRGFVTVKFNFPYTEAGRRAPDRMPALEACYRAVVEHVRRELRPARLFLGGKSMGGRVASHLAAQGLACDGLVFLGYPLHPAGKPQQLRDAHLPAIRVPMLFLAGTRDSLCDLALLRPVLARLSAPVALHVLEGGDHSFAVPKRLARGQPVVEELCDAIARWAKSG